MVSIRKCLGKIKILSLIYVNLVIIKAVSSKIKTYKKLLNNKKLYSTENVRIKSNEKFVINNMIYENYNLGLCDRLQGAVSVYYLIEKYKLSSVFKINFTYPFNLTLFLEPNLYNWVIDIKNVSFNTKEVNIILMFGIYWSKIESRLFRIYFLLKLKLSGKKQTHLYTNIQLLDEKTFSKLFNELFKPTAAIQTEIDSYKALINDSYISATFRFQNLIGDFKELNIEPLIEQEKQELIDRCTEELLRLHNKNRDKKMLVTSDSTTFLKHINKFDFTYIVEGDLVHMAFTDDGSFDLHKKSFIDLYMIAGAEKAYLLRTGAMYSSGFPRTAAKINLIPFEEIVF
ncbi:MAG: hypothetical protein R3Y50_02080 [Rikenellaceae bacterium]